MSTVESNFRNTHIAGALTREGDAAKINYGFNSGGYENNLFFVTADGEALSIDTVIGEINKVDFNDPDDKQWFIIGADVNYEDGDLTDAHTGARIPAAHS